MDEQVVILRQGEPVVVLRERQVPLVIQHETPTAIRVDRFGTTFNNPEPEVTDLLAHYILLTA
jgi:hypothetical protein